MNQVLLLVKDEVKLSPKKIITELIFITVGTLILYLAFIAGFKNLIPRINSVETTKFMFASITIFLPAIATFILSTLHTWNFVNREELLEQIRISNLFYWQIYLYKSIYFMLHSVIYVIISTLLIFALINFSINFLNILLFWIYYILCSIFIIQVGILIGIFVRDVRYITYIFSFIILPLFIASGTIVPTEFYPEIIDKIIYYLPTTAMIEGGRSLIINRSFNTFYLIYIVIMDCVIYFAVIQSFRKKLKK
jgi:ABC-type polysaccharide/polyol phosphate export permease